MRNRGLTARRLRELLSYDPETGVFRWRVRRSQRCKPGEIAGSSNANGYWVIGLDYGLYKAHRLAWLYQRGRWPHQQIDHVNRITGDNRWANLRAASPADNSANAKRRKRDGHKGVYWVPRLNKYKALFTRNYQVHYLGLFKTEAAAVRAYARKSKELRGEFGV